MNTSCMLAFKLKILITYLLITVLVPNELVGAIIIYHLLTALKFACHINYPLSLKTIPELLALHLELNST